MRAEPQTQQVPQPPIPVTRPRQNAADSPLPRAAESAKTDNRLIVRFLFLVDLSLIWFAAVEARQISHSVAKAIRYPAGQDLSQSKATGCLLLFSLFTILFMQMQGEYVSLWKRSIQREIRLLAQCMAAAVFVTGASLHYLGVAIGNKVTVALTIGLGWMLLSLWRAVLRFQPIEGLSEQRNVLIVGCGPNGKLLRTHVEQNPELGYSFKGYVDRRLNGRPPNAARNPEEGHILGPADKLEAIVRAHFIDEIFVSVPSDRHLVKMVARNARCAGIPVRVIPELDEGLASGHPDEFAVQFPTLTSHRRPHPTFQLIMKRLLDLGISVCALCALAPVLLLIALVVKLDSKGPVLYESFRVGKKGKTFLCYKFRTMVLNADALKESLKHLNERSDILFKISEDPRVTRIGRVLRKYSLDELPQLWNVLKGEMSLVGPRPPVPGEYNQYALEHLCRLDVMPGVTGLWQVKARRDPSFESYIQLDKEYVSNWSFWLDCQILWQTIGVVFLGTGR